MTASDRSPERELIRRWFEDLFNSGELDVADEILAEDVDYHGPPSLSPQAVTGPQDIKDYVEVYGSAFPDLTYTIDEVSQGDGDLHVRWSATGTHESDLFGMEPTGEVFTISGINIFHIENGRISEIYSKWDTLKMVQELGVVPPVGLASE